MISQCKLYDQYFSDNLYELRSTDFPAMFDDTEGIPLTIPL